MPSVTIPGRPPPTTLEAIEAVAQRQPRRLAVAEDTRRWTYEGLYRAVSRFSDALHTLGVQRGQRVAVSGLGYYLQLVLLIACENLGAVTATFLPEGDSDAPTLFGLCDWVVSERTQACPPHARFVLIDEAFVDKAMGAAQSHAPGPRVALRLDEPARISRTSGSSGRSRFMLLNRQAQEYWIRLGAENGDYRPHTRLLVASPLLINAAYARSCACLRLGAAVLSVSGAALAQLQVTDMFALPIRLADLLDELQPGFVSPQPIAVGTVGGFVTPELRERTQRVFGGRIVNRYGANEVGAICEDLDAQGSGLLSAGVDLRIVDADGRDLQRGQSGIIAVRTPAMANCYLGDAQASAAAFRDGWFYSGDTGALVGERQLRLTGRHDDLLNVGGLKIPAEQVQARVRDVPHVRDCAALAVNLQQGAVTVGLALVAESGADLQALLPQVRQALALGRCTAVRLIWVDELPRMPTGKIDRMALLARLHADEAAA